MIRKRWVFWMIAFVLATNSNSAENRTSSGNIIKDGGFETVKEVAVGSNKYIHKLIQEGADLGKGDAVVLLPSNFSQACGVKRFKVIEGTPGKEVHTGKRAIALNGSVYFQARPKAETGDLFIVKYYVKGKGTVRAILHLTNNEGKYYGQSVPKKVKVDTDKWTLVTQKLKTNDKPDLERVWLRLAASGDIMIDDLSMEKVGNQGSIDERYPFVFAKETKEKIKIDGVMRENAWESASKAGPFVEIYNNSAIAIPKTFFRVLYDENNVYIGIEAKETHPERITLKKSAKDSWPRGSNIELFLDTNNDKDSYYQMACNLTGSLYDADKRDKTWNTDWQAVSKIQGKRWTMEIRIPFKDLKGGVPSIGSAWGLNICRGREGGITKSSSWAPVGGYFHNPGKFNTMIFGSYDDWWNHTSENVVNDDKKINALIKTLGPAEKKLVRKLKLAASMHKKLSEEIQNNNLNAMSKKDFKPIYEKVQKLIEKYNEIADETEVLCAIKGIAYKRNH